MSNYDYDGLIHNYFFNDKLDSQSTGNGRMSFDGTIIYSYWAKLARMVTLKDSKILIVDTSTKYASNTSLKHTNKLIRGCPYPVYYESYFNADDIIPVLAKELESTIAKFSRARSKKQYWGNEALSIFSSLSQYCELTGKDINDYKDLVANMLIIKGIL